MEQSTGGQCSCPTENGFVEENGQCICPAGYIPVVIDDVGRCVIDTGQEYEDSTGWFKIAQDSIECES